MSDFHKAFPPIETRDNVPAVCFAAAMLGLVLGGLIVTARMYPVEIQVAISTSAQTVPGE
jgi:hypothetical protein